MAQAVSRRPLTAEARVRYRVSPRGFCCGRRGTGTGFTPSTSVFPFQFHSTSAPLLAKMKNTNHRVAVRPYHLLRGPFPLKKRRPIPVAVWFEAQVSGRSITGIVSSNSAEGMNVRLLCLLCVVQVAASAKADHSFRGVIPGVCVCLIVCDL